MIDTLHKRYGADTEVEVASATSAYLAPPRVIDQSHKRIYLRIGTDSGYVVTMFNGATSYYCISISKRDADIVLTPSLIAGFYP